MNLETCRECKKLFYYLSGDRLCPACKKYLDAKLKEAKEYVDENDKAGIKQVAVKCEVDMPQVKQWVQEESLHTADELMVYSKCNGCGQPIPFGNFCNTCKSQLLRGIGNALESEDTEAEPANMKKRCAKMRFFR